MELFTLILGFLFFNNLFLYFTFGWETYLPAGMDTSSVLKQSLVLCLFFIFSSLLLWPIEVYLLEPFGLNLFRAPLYVLILWLLSEGLRLAWGQVFKTFHFPGIKVILTNSLVLGGVLLVMGKNLDFFTTFIVVLAASIGFLLAQSLLLQLENRLIKEKLPAAFSGLPIQLISAGLMGLSFLGFSQFLLKGS